MQYIMSMTPALPDDEHWMKYALKLAAQAAQMGEVPVGAVVVHDGVAVGEAFNRKESMPQATAHAELMAIEAANRHLGRWRLHGCTLYVTLEPCLMCVGAIVQSRVERVVFGTSDPKAGAIESQYQVFSDQKLNHTPTLTAGVLREECAQILSEFFSQLRQKRKGVSD